MLGSYAILFNNSGRRISIIYIILVIFFIVYVSLNQTLMHSKIVHILYFYVRWKTKDLNDNDIMFSYLI